MSFVSINFVMDHLNLPFGSDDGGLQSKIDAAEAYVASFVGPIGDLLVEVPAPTEDDPEAVTEVLPAPLVEAVCQLAGHFFENREASIIGESVRPIPFGFHDLISPYRKWGFA